MQQTRVTGFNLIELTITLVILSLIITAAIPSYKQHIQATRRLDAQTGLFNLMGYLERYYLLHHSYEQASFAKLGISDKSPEGFYQLEIRAITPTAYTLAAIPLGAQQADHTCANFTLDHLGQKGISGDGKVAECWK